MTVRVLPLNLPSVNTKLTASNRLISLWDEGAYRPCALPITCDVSSGPSVRGSSTTTTWPKRVGEDFVVLASATITANSIWLTFGSPRPSFAWHMGMEEKKSSNEVMPVANAAFPLILDLGKIE
ncbi:hypothetical protein AMTRI_Chr09g21330 [Amborella trichopoda]